MVDVNLVWLWTECYQCCDYQLARPSQIMCACGCRTLWAHAV